MEENLYFGYLNLYDVLKKFYDNNVSDIKATLIISLEKEYYMGENMKFIMSDLRRLMKNKRIIWDIDGDKAEFKISNLRVFVCDSLNVHMFYYRHCAKYFDEHHIDDENLIPLEIRKKFEEISYRESREAGQVWFRDNIDAFNLFSNEKILTNNFQLDDYTTTVFEETNETPRLECVRYEQYYKLEEYYKILKAVENLKSNCNFIDRCYTHEAEYFYNRLKSRNETPKYRDLFIQQSKKYLTDETVPAVMSNKNDVFNNHIDFYYYGKTPMHLEVYMGKQAEKNKLLNQYIQSGLLKGINDTNYVSLREKEF